MILERLKNPLASLKPRLYGKKKTMTDYAAQSELLWIKQNLANLTVEEKREFLTRLRQKQISSIQPVSREKKLSLSYA